MRTRVETHPVRRAVQPARRTAQPGLEHVAAKVSVLRDSAQLLLDEGFVDHEHRATAILGVEADFLEQLLHHRLKPPRPEELEENRPLKGDGEEDDEGLIFVGDRGKILCTFNGGNPKLIPQTKMDSYKQPPKTLPRSPGNEREWLDACKGGKVKPGGNFEFEGLVTETLLLGNVATQMGQKLNWDRSSLKVANSDVAQKYVRPERRSGWEI